MMVLDASVVVKTYLEEAGSEEATELLTGWSFAKCLYSRGWTTLL